MRKRLNLRDLNKDDSSISPTPTQQTKEQQIEGYNLKNQRSSIASCSSLSSNISSSSNNSSSSGAFSLGSTEDANKELESAAMKKEDSDDKDMPNTFAEKKSWMLSMMYGKTEDKKDDIEMKNDLTTAKLSSPASKLTKNWQPMTTTAIVSTKEEISGSSIGVKNIKERIMNGDDQPVKKVIPNYLRNVKQENLLGKETEFLQWEQLKSTLSRPLLIKDLDFTDLKNDDDTDICQVNVFNNCSNGIPAPPPPLPNGNLNGGFLPPPPLPPPINTNQVDSSLKNKINNTFSLSKSSLSSNSSNYNSYSSSTFGSLRSNLSTSSSKNSSIDSTYSSMRQASTTDKFDTLGKSKKTLKLFWKEVKEDKGLLSRLKRKKTIWDEIENVQVDTEKLEHLFENRTKELSNKVS